MVQEFKNFQVLRASFLIKESVSGEEVEVYEIAYCSDVEVSDDYEIFGAFTADGDFIPFDRWLWVEFRFKDKESGFESSVFLHDEQFQDEFAEVLETLEASVPHKRPTTALDKLIAIDVGLELVKGKEGSIAFKAFDLQENPLPSMRAMEQESFKDLASIIGFLPEHYFEIEEVEA